MFCYKAKYRTEIPLFMDHLSEIIQFIVFSIGCTIWCLHDLGARKCVRVRLKLSNKLKLNHKMHCNLEREE